MEVCFICTITPTTPPMMSIPVKRKTVIMDEIKDDFKLWNVLWPSMTHSGWTSRFPKRNEPLVDRIYFINLVL
jgi:hypothetical protein